MTLQNKMAFSRSQNGKSRFWFTVVGVALSTAMLLAVFLGSDAALDVMRRYTICQQGEWFWSMLQLPGPAAQFLEESAGAGETVGVYGGMYQAAGPDGSAVTLYGTDQAFFAMMQTELVEGRWPACPQEIVVKQDSTGWSLGDALQVTDADGAVQSLTVVGVYGRSVLDLQLPAAEGAVTAFYGIDWANPCGEDVYRFFSMPEVYTDSYRAGIAQTSGAVLEGNPQVYLLYNNALITFSGYSSPGGQNHVQAVVLALRAFLLLIIAFASVLLITNSFSISLAQKKKELALLVSVGATTRQVGACLLYEALQIGLIGIPCGVLLGYGSLFVAFRLLSPLTENAGAMLGGDLAFHLRWNPVWALLTVALSAVVLVLSAKRAMRMFQKESVIGNLFGNGEVKVNRRVTHQGKFAARFFGPEAGLAVKQAKRNWRSYRSAVRSLAACMVVFVGAAGLSAYLPSAYFSQQDIPAGPITVDYASSKENLTQTQAFQKLMAPETPVEAITVTETGYFDPQGIPADRYTEQSIRFMDLLNAVREGEQYSAAIQFEIIPDEEFEKWAGAQAVPDGEIGCILKNRFFYTQEEITQTNFRAGDLLDTSLDGMPVSLRMVRVDQKQFVENRVGNLPALSVVIKRTDAEALFSRLQQQTGRVSPRAVSICYQTDSPLRLQNELSPYCYNELFTAGTADYLVLSDNSVELMLIGIVYLLLHLICYGFSAMLALLSICQMITTISTELALQRKDFALLQSIGAGEQSLKRVVLFQAVLYLANAIKWAAPLGFALLLGEYKLLRSVAGFVFVVPWWAFATILLVSAAVAGLVVISPIRSLRKQSIVENIRANG